MTMTKSEAARFIAAGLMVESFHHETLGNFNISLLRARIARNEPETYRCLYSDISMVDGIKMDAIEHLIGSREIDEARCRELTDKQLEEPVIFLQCPEGSNGEQASQLLVDGVHRFVERRKRGWSFFDFYLIPLADAPTVDERLYANVPWGEKELVPGKGLVKRE